MLTLGKIIRGIRKFRGEKKKSLAESLGFSAPTMTRIEMDDPKVELGKLIAVTRALGIPFDPATRTARVPLEVSDEVVTQLAQESRRGGFNMLVTGTQILERRKRAASQSPKARAAVERKKGGRE